MASWLRLFLCCISFFPQCTYVDSAVLLWHVDANILWANGRTTGALWYPNSFDGSYFGFDCESNVELKAFNAVGNLCLFHLTKLGFFLQPFLFLAEAFTQRKGTKTVRAEHDAHVYLIKSYSMIKLDYFMSLLILKAFAENIFHRYCAFMLFMPTCHTLTIQILFLLIHNTFCFSVL